MNAQTNTNVPDNTLEWLLEESSPGVRYLTLTNICGESEQDAAVSAARDACYSNGEIAQVLDKMDEEGFWVRAGHGYGPKYRGTAWSLILLSQLGAKIEYDPRIKTACDYYLSVNMSDGGKFTATGTASGTIDCLQGNMCAALKMLGCDDPRLDTAYDWLTRSNTGDGVERYYRYKPGPDCVCGVNNDRPCAWGAIKCMLALSKVPSAERTEEMNKVIEIGEELLLGVDPSTADYPTKDDKKPSRSWFKVGFPVFYVADVLQNLEVLIALGHADDSRLQNALDMIWKKRDDQNRWSLEYNYIDKTWLNFGPKREPNKWVTYRVANVLNKAQLQPSLV